MTIGTVLGPLRERYATWMDLDTDQVSRDREEDPAQIRALQLVLRLERDEQPSRSGALALAATGCARLVLDPRAEPGGPWHDAVDAYCRGHIRKVTRRARGAQWEATADLPGLTLADGPTQVRVLLPGLVSELDKRVAKLQVGGTDLPPDPAPDARHDDRSADDRSADDRSADEQSADDRSAPRGTGAPPVLTCSLPPSDLTAGKLMAQTGHAGMIAAALAAADDPDLLTRWRDAGCPARVATLEAHQWSDLLAAVRAPESAWRGARLLAVRDAGFTEVDPGTVTVAARLD